MVLLSRRWLSCPADRRTSGPGIRPHRCHPRSWRRTPPLCTWKCQVALVQISIGLSCYMQYDLYMVYMWFIHDLYVAYIYIYGLYEWFIYTVRTSLLCGQIYLQLQFQFQVQLNVVCMAYTKGFYCYSSVDIVYYMSTIFICHFISVYIYIYV